MEKYEEIEHDLITKYRKKIWRKFRNAIEEYEMLKDGDKIMVCISGGKDSMLMAKCFQELKKHGEYKIDVEYVVMDPGYQEENLLKIEENARLLQIPIQLFHTNIFQVVEKSQGKSPCFLCAKMRRGALYEQAEKLGCNKIALGHHYDDVLETILLSMLYGSELKSMMPKLHSDHFRLEVIRPMYLIKEADILAWKNRYGLTFINCACKVTKKIAENDENESKRYEMKQLIKQFRKMSPYIEGSLFHSVKNINLNTVIAYHKDGVVHHFLEEYDTMTEKGEHKVAKEKGEKI